VTAPLHVLTLADERFVLPLAVLVRSILDHLAPTQALRLTVADGGVTNRSRERLLACWTDPRLEVSWRPPAFGTLAELPVAGRIPPLTYARLSVAELVPADCARALVLDADQLVLTDLARLASEPFLGACVLAPRDPFIPSVASRNGLAGFAGLGLEPDTPFLTGAAMVVDVAAWRREGLGERALAYVAEHGGRLHSYDQDALNAVLPGRWRELDARWQVQPRALSLRPDVTPHLDAATRALQSADPWLVHFSGRLKPWLYRGRSRFDALFHATLARTGLAPAWRPSGPRALLFALYDGPLRRLVYPLEVRVDAALRELLRRRTVAPSPR
jgi:lipopolysaccharide biosynthesis glycosyltransferase